MQGFSKIAAPLISISTRITVKYDEIDGGGDKLVEKLSKSQRIVKIRKTSKV